METPIGKILIIDDETVITNMLTAILDENGRVDEARAVLIGVLTDSTEDAGARTIARSLLAGSFGPMDEASAAAVSRYDAEQKGR